MRFDKFLIKYEAEDIKIGNLFLVRSGIYFTVGTLENISYEMPENPLKGYMSVFTAHSVHLEVGKKSEKSQQILFTEGSISEMSNRQNWNDYFIVDKENSISKIFEKMTDDSVIFNKKIERAPRELFLEVVKYMETADEISDKIILNLLENHQDIYSSN